MSVIESNFIAYSINKTQMKRLESLQRTCLRRIHYRSNSNIDFETFLKTNQIKTIEERRKFEILILLQKTKLNFDNIPKTWKENLNFVQHLPTGRDGWKLNCNTNDDKIFYYYASKLYNNLDLKSRNEFTLSKFKQLLKVQRVMNQ